MKKAQNDENDLSDLENTPQASRQAKPKLSQVIHYDTDIAPYRLIKIYSGVGSGKNYFVDRLVCGDKFTHADGTPVGPKSVLLLSQVLLSEESRTHLPSTVPFSINSTK